VHRTIPPLLVALFVGFLPSCRKNDVALDHEVMADETRLIQLQQNSRLLQYRLDQRTPAEKEWHEWQRQELAALDQLDKLKQQIRELRADLETIAQLEQEYTARFHGIQQEKRLQAMDRKFDVFSSTQRNYQDVVITAVDDQGIQITHKDGRARVKVEDLSDDQLATFGLNRSQAITSRQEEHKKAIAYHRWVDQSLQRQEYATPAAEAPAPRAPATYTAPRSSPFRYSSSTPKTVYRVRNQGRPSYYYVYPQPYCPSTQFNPNYYRIPR